tara:strand:- start:135 stop:1301 length:1167 start_codon:yes stop_codon:yes gene_type:complete
MLDYLSEEVESVRFRQKARIKEQQESRCDFDGKPGRSTVSIAAAASTEARRRLSRAAEATHPQAGSRRGRRQLKGKPASTVASATVSADGDGGGEETAADLKLHLKHFYGFFGLMALLLVFTLVTSPRLDWMVKRVSKRIEARVKRTKLAKRISLSRSSTMSSFENMGDEKGALGAVSNFGMALVHANERFVKSVSDELDELNGELEKDHIEGEHEEGGSASKEEIDVQKEALSDIMTILQSLQASVQKIEAEQARRPHSSESSTPRSSERNSLILRPQSGHLGVRKRRSTGKDASPPKSGLGTALEAGVVLDSAPSPASSTWRLPYGLRAPGSRASSSRGSSGTGVPQALTKLKSSMRKRRSASPAPNTQAGEPAPNTQADDQSGSA